MAVTDGKKMSLDTNDVVAIQQLLALYSHVVDAEAQDRFQEIFTEDGIFDTTQVKQKVYRGLDTIRAYFAATGSASGHKAPVHTTTTIRVYEEDGEVRAISKYMTVSKDGVRSGDYRDRLVRVDDGWRIRERVVVGRYPNPYRDPPVLFEPPGSDQA